MNKQRHFLLIFKMMNLNSTMDLEQNQHHVKIS